MGWGQVVAAVIALIVKLASAWLDRNAERRKKKLEALNEVKAGLKVRDASRVTSGFDRVNRL